VPGLGLTPDKLSGETEELVNAIGNKTGHYKRRHIFTLSTLPGDVIIEERDEGVRIQGNTVNETEDARQMCCRDGPGKSLFLAMGYKGSYNHTGRSLSTSLKAG